MNSLQKGFTLIEVLLSVVIIGMLVGLSLPLFQSFQVRNDLDITTQSLADALRRAQTYARDGNGDSMWSVSIQSGAGMFYLYKGATFASRDSSYDESTTLQGNITGVSGLSDISFAKLTGTPLTTGTITLTTGNNEVRTVTINAKGMVSY
ncbi:MAG TPA: prepilin-type N-terminal cleavage/methylation domain-containing protein [Candidatus Saccharimonadales bacterium]